MKGYNLIYENTSLMVPCFTKVKIQFQENEHLSQKMLTIYWKNLKTFPHPATKRDILFRDRMNQNPYEVNS